MGRRARLIAAGAATLAAAVLGYGAWRAHRYADLILVLNDVSQRDARVLWVELREGQLVLRDAAGAALATARFDASGVLRYEGEGAIDCAESLHGEAWQRCADARSRWLSDWVDRATQADVLHTGACRIAGVPLQRRNYNDWWLWWVPLPHVGGEPKRLIALTAFIDAKRCTAATGP